MARARAVVLLVSLFVSKGVGAFSNARGRVKAVSKNECDEAKNEFWKGVGSAAAACSIVASVAGTSVLSPAVANAADKVELSSGSIIIKTSTLPSAQALLQTTELDSTALLKTLFQNRNELKESVASITQSITHELNTKPVWKQIAKEVLTIEGDVLPELTVRAPADIKQTFKDLSKGKLNLLVNNEVINLSIQPTFTEEEDEIVFTIKGFKGAAPPALPALPPQLDDTTTATAFTNTMNNVQAFWNAPFYSYSTKDTTTTITNGQVTTAGTIFGIAASYIGSYQYYLNEIQKAEEEAEAKRRKIAAAKKKKAEAEEEKKKKEEEALVKNKRQDKKKAEAKKKADADAAAKKKQAADVEAKKKAAEEEAKKWAAAVDNDEQQQEDVTKEEEEGGTTRKHRFRFWKNKE